MATAVIMVPTIVTAWLMNSSRNWRERRRGPKSARQRGAALGGSPSRAMSADTAPRYAQAAAVGGCARVSPPGAAIEPAHTIDGRRVRLGQRPAVERRLGVVLDPELDRLCDLVAGDERRQREAHVDAGRHAGRGHDLALDHDPLLGVGGARTRPGARWPTSASSPPGPEGAPAAPEDVGPRAHRGGPLRARVDPADPVGEARLSRQPASAARRVRPGRRRRRSRRPPPVPSA